MKKPAARFTAPRVSDPGVQRALDQMADEINRLRAQLGAGSSRGDAPAVTVVEDGSGSYLEARTRRGRKRIPLND